MLAGIIDWDKHKAEAAESRAQEKQEAADALKVKRKPPKPLYDCLICNCKIDLDNSCVCGAFEAQRILAETLGGNKA